MATGTHQLGDYTIEDDSNGDLVIKDTNGNKVLRWDTGNGQWNLEGQTFTNAGSFSTGKLFGAEPNVNYANPSWLVDTNALYYETNFRSLDGHFQSTSGSASISLSYFDVTLSTGSTSGSVAEARDRTDGIPPGASVSWDSDRTWGASLSIEDAVTDRTDFIGTGFIANGGAGFGFKISNGDLLGMVHNGSSENTTTLLSSFSTGDYNLIARFTAGSDVVFEVNGTQEGTISSGLPTGTTGFPEMVYNTEVENSTSADRRQRFYSVRVVQHP